MTLNPDEAFLPRSGLTRLTAYGNAEWTCAAPSGYAPSRCLLIGKDMVPRWRQLAQILLPEVYGKERPNTLYSFFFTLSSRGHDALRSDNTETLARIHAFTEWCACHEERYIWNAAGVAFYEHLFDSGVGVERVVPWLSAQVYAQVKGLLEWRLGADRTAEIEHAMQHRKISHGALIRSTLDLHLAQLHEDYKNRAANLASI